MKNTISSTQIKPGMIFLILLMAATRFQHFGNSISVPDASLAIFFLAGLWLGGWKFFSLLLIEAGLIDYIAISQFSVSDYCISPAYVFLIPTYAALWFGGRYCAKISNQSFSHLPTQVMILIVSTSIAFLVSNGSFYLLSDKFPDINLVEYASRVMQYYPPYLNYCIFYVVLIYGMKQLVSQMTLFQSETR